jgi:phosphoglycolate phosphatase-like HAD superfamily hydrolase
VSLEIDLERFIRAIAGRLIDVDGPLKDRRGLFYRCGNRTFRKYDAAIRYRERHNRVIRAEGRLAMAAPALFRAAKTVVARWDKGNLAEAVRSLAAVIATIEGRNS